MHLSEKQRVSNNRVQHSRCMQEHLVNYRVCKYVWYLLYQEMKDDLDHYTNTYHIFTKAPDNLEEVLACSQVINWEQDFQIQGNWSELKGKYPLVYSQQIWVELCRAHLPPPSRLPRKSEWGNKKDFSFKISAGGLHEDHALLNRNTTGTQDIKWWQRGFDTDV